MLENKYSYWEFESETWDEIIASEEDKETIFQSEKGDVLTIEESIVILKKNGSDDQKWIKGKSDADGWFTLKDPITKKFLTNNQTSTIIEGKKIRLKTWL